MFDYLGIDWGSKRCGIAFGDIHTRLVLPAAYECAAGNIFEIIKDELIDKNIHTIVLGRPTNFNLNPTEVTFHVEDFKMKLLNLFPEITVITINENGSSKVAKENGIKNKTMINHLAACDILKAYFDKVSRR